MSWVPLKARAAVKMAKRALDQVARAMLEESGHRQTKYCNESSRSKKGKPTGMTKNHRWSHKAHDHEAH